MARTPTKLTEFQESYLGHVTELHWESWRMRLQWRNAVRTAVAEGIPVSRIAEAVGISRSTIYAILLESKTPANGMLSW